MDSLGEAILEWCAAMALIIGIRLLFSYADYIYEMMDIVRKSAVNRLIG